MIMLEGVMKEQCSEREDWDMPFVIKTREKCVWCQGHGDRCDECNGTGHDWRRRGGAYKEREYAIDILRMVNRDDADKLVAYVEEETDNE